MRSEIKIDYVDRGQGRGLEPVIRVEQKSSDDPRDKLIAALFQSLQNDSPKYLEIIYSNYTQTVTREFLPEAEHQILLFKPEEKEHWVHDNSTGFRKFLDDKRIKYRGEGHHTVLIGDLDYFELGVEFQKHKAKEMAKLQS